MTKIDYHVYNIFQDTKYVLTDKHETYVNKQ